MYISIGSFILLLEGGKNKSKFTMMGTTAEKRRNEMSSLEKMSGGVTLTS